MRAVWSACEDLLVSLSRKVEWWRDGYLRSRKEIARVEGSRPLSPFARIIDVRPRTYVRVRNTIEIV
jgi:hypothetical protein